MENVRTVFRGLDVYGDYLHQPNGAFVQIDLKPVKDRIKQLPATTTGKILGIDEEDLRDVYSVLRTRRRRVGPVLRNVPPGAKTPDLRAGLSLFGS